MGKRFFSISFDIDTIAYGVHAALKAAVIMITIRVTFLSLRATISAILPVAFNELWKNVVYHHFIVIILDLLNLFVEHVTIYLINLPAYEFAVPRWR